MAPSSFSSLGGTVETNKSMDFPFISSFLAAAAGDGSFPSDGTELHDAQEPADAVLRIDRALGISSNEWLIHVAVGDCQKHQAENTSYRVLSIASRFVDTTWSYFLSSEQQ